jgi:CRISPR-associated protein Csd1
MMLAELYALALREGLVADPDYEPKPISYVIVIGPAGRLLSIVSTLTPPASGKGKPQPARKSVPRERVRTSGVLPQFLWDKAEYVFGLDPQGKKSGESLARRREAFVAEVARVARATSDPALVDVVAWLTSLRDAPLSVDALAAFGVKELEANANFAFRHSSDPEGLVSDREAVRHFWKAEQASQAERREGIQCLVTGEIAAPIDSHPQIRRVPGAFAKGVPLVSFNQGAFLSYGLKGNENAPIGQRAAEAIATALTRLLDKQYPNPIDNTPMPVRRVDIASDTAVVFWARADDAVVDIFEGTIQADPAKVRALYESPEGGRPAVLDDPSPFFALALSGELARAKVRGWFETTLGEALANVRAHFDDLTVVQPAFRAGAPMPLWALLKATAPLADSSRLAPSLAATTFFAILMGRPYPRMLLEGAVRRARIEHDVTPERAALIKACLVRTRRADRRSDLPEVTPHMNTETTNVSYRLGRLFAALEKLQQEAIDPSATIRDRYFGAASATPRTVFARLIRGAQPHISKAQRGVYFERLIQEILAPVSAFPGSLTLEEQGLFALGYYHQRQAFFEKRDAAPTAA